MAISLKQAQDVVCYAPAQDMVVLVSPPGTGKSVGGAVHAAARTGETYRGLYCPTFEAVETRGLPVVLTDERGEKIMSWAAPNILPLARYAEQYKGQSFLVNLDDVFQSPPPTLRAFVRSVYGDGQARHLGDFELFPNMRFMGTGNREQDRSGVYRPEQYVNDRITYLEIEPSVDEWVSGAIGGFKPPALEPGYAELRERINKAVALGIPDEVIAYAKKFSQCYDFSTEQRSFLSPRSLERLGRFLRAMDAAGVDGAVTHEIACGTIGDAHAVKFMAFRKLREELPDVDALLKGEDVPIPPKTEVLFILVTSVLRAAKKEHCAAVAKLAERLAKLKKEGTPVGVEVSAYLITECLRGSGKELRGLASHPLFMKWIKDNGKYFK